MSEFIFMLTRADKTLPESREILDEIAGTGVRFIGYKDVGVSREELGRITEKIRRNGQSPVLEVVSLSEEDEMRSIETALELEVDYLIGGTRPQLGVERLRGAPIKYFPYVGNVVGHPARLEGDIETIAGEAVSTARLGVDGINLLAYRHDGDGLALASAVQAAVDLPLICAGSVDSLDRVAALAEIGVWAFTIGSAAVNRSIVPNADLAGQLTAILGAAGQPT